MLTLLIVDDEPSTRNGLADYYDWAAHGITKVYTAEDGDQALETFGEVGPDLVLTDVKMPGMDGIQLAERIRSLRSDVQIIFISGHDDISFMKSALQVDAVDYIMKPINMRELSSVIDRTVKQVYQERDRRKLLSDMNARLSQSLPLLREKFWLRAIRDGFEPSNEHLAFLDIEVPLTGKYCVFVISLDDWTTVSKSMTERDRQLIAFALLNITQEIIDRSYRGCAFEHRQGEFACVLDLSKEDDEDGLYELLNSIRLAITKLLKLSITIGVGRSVFGFGQLPSSYETAIDAVGQKLVLGKNRIIINDSLRADPEPFYKLHPQHASEFASCILSGDAECTLQLLGRCFEELTSSPKASLRNFQNFCLQLLLIGSNVLMEMNINDRDASAVENECWEALSKLETAEDMHQLLQHYLRQTCGLVLTKRRNRSWRGIEEIKDIIEERYADPHLTIQSIADHVFLTSTYISLMFKQETGMTIHDYLTGIRMERAKKLLTETRRKLAEICVDVGYTDPSYFTKQFKKNTGFTPREFRENCR